MSLGCDLSHTLAGGYVANRQVRSQVAGGTAVLLAFALLAACSNNEPDFRGGPRGPDPAVSGVAGPLADGNRLSPYGDGNWTAYAATPLSARLHVADRPAGRTIRTLPSRLPVGAPLTLLVVGRRTEWVQVELPVRPNGTTGWVRASDVELTGLKYSLALERGAHRLK